MVKKCMINLTTRNYHMFIQCVALWNVSSKSDTDWWICMGEGAISAEISCSQPWTWPWPREAGNRGRWSCQQVADFDSLPVVASVDITGTVCKDFTWWSNACVIIHVGDLNDTSALYCIPIASVKTPVQHLCGGHPRREVWWSPKEGLLLTAGFFPLIPGLAEPRAAHGKHDGAGSGACRSRRLCRPFSRWVSHIFI